MPTCNLGLTLWDLVLLIDPPMIINTSYIGNLYAAFEFAPHGNLKEFLQKNSVPESQRQQFIQNVTHLKDHTDPVSTGCRQWNAVLVQ